MPDQSLALPMSRVRSYYMLAKPGIIYGNCLSTAAGFLVATRTSVDWRLLLASLSGTALVIGSGCVLNNIIDRTIDAKMQRTKVRALVNHSISPSNALLFAITLSLAGFGILAAFTNLLTVYVGIVGLYSYVLVYSVAKRHSPLGTPLGSIAGATPIVAGYTAATGTLDTTALLLFALMALWQMPHFFAIAMYRLDDYRAAGLPVLPAVKGNARTKLQILLYIAAYAVAAAMLTVRGTTGILFLVAMTAVNAAWFWKGLRGYRAADDAKWAQKMFGFSLIVLLVFSAGLSLNRLLL